MRNPWLDFASYQYSDRNRFKGREEDIAKFKLIMADGTMSVLYADSGIGKTSFINAGIDPQFIEMGYFPIHVLFNEDAFNGDLDVEGWLVSNIESKFYELIKTNDPEKESKRQIKDWYYLHSEEYSEIDSLRNNLWWRLHAYKIIDKKNREIVKPLIVFDQFEEVFIKGKTDFLVSLFSVIERISSSTLPYTVSNVLDKLDEFEDLEIDRLHNFKILFSLRKEYLSDFDYWCNDKYSITELFQNRMLLNALTRHQAKQVICEQDGIDTLDDVADEIIEKIDDKHHDAVEPFLLSVCCSRLYEKAVHLKKAILKKEDLEYIDIKNNIIRSFYEEKISTLIPNEEHRLIFETTLVDDDGYRRRERAKCRKLEAINFKKNYLDDLDKSHIIRVDTIEYEVYVEIIHDRIADVIKDNKIQHEKEILLKEQEKQRKKNTEQRKKKNLERFKSSQNVLSIKGRRIWDNKSFTFSVDNDRSNTLSNSSERIETGLSRNTINVGDNHGEHFIDQLLNQVVGPDVLLIDFKDNQSKDGISSLEIHTCSIEDSKDKRKIKSVLFFIKDKNKTNQKFYTKDGFYGIELNYNADGSESEIKYLCDGYTSKGIVSVKFEYNSDGFPISAMYYDAEGKPCKHFDGNYGVQMEYDEFGNETKRWFIDSQKNKTSIYNGIAGINSLYDENDRLKKQYFVDEIGKKTYDIYGYHGVEYKYSHNKLDINYIDIFDNLMYHKDGFCIEEQIFDDEKHVIEQRYFDKKHNPVNRHDDSFHYFCISIEYNINDLIKIIKLTDVDGNLVNKIRYDYYRNGLISKQGFYGIKSTNTSERKHLEDDYQSDANGVFEIRFDYTDQGLLKKLSHWNFNGESIQDKTGIRSGILQYDNQGRLFNKKIYKDTDELAEEETEIEYLNDGTCKITDFHYQIKKRHQLIDRIKKWATKSTDADQLYRTLLRKDIFYGILNIRAELIEIECEENNEFIPGTPLKVKQIYDSEGNIVEQRLCDRTTGEPICDSDGVYGWRTETSSSSSSTIYLDSNYEIGDNKYGYAIEKNLISIIDEKECKTTCYYNKFNQPVQCQEGFHKKISTNIINGNEDLQNIQFFDNQDNPIDCIDDYHKQLCEIVELDNNNIQIILSYFNINDQPVINKKVGYHKKVEIYNSTEDYISLRCFFDNEDNLVNCQNGFAKLKIKRDTSWKVLFHYPFCDHDILRFYDSNNQKVDIAYTTSTGQEFKEAYKIIKQTAGDIPYAIYNANSKRKYIEYSLYWKYSFLLIVPITITILLVGYSVLNIFKKVWSVIKKLSKKEKGTTNSVIIVNELIDIDKGYCPLRNFDIKPDSWIIEWNNWSYSLDDNSISLFEAEFNKREKDKSIIFYNPKETDISKRFKRIKYYGDNIGAKLTNAEVEKDSVIEMLELLHKL